MTSELPLCDLCVVGMTLHTLAFVITPVIIYKFALVASAPRLYCAPETLDSCSLLPQFQRMWRTYARRPQFRSCFTAALRGPCASQADKPLSLWESLVLWYFVCYKPPAIFLVSDLGSAVSSCSPDGQYIFLRRSMLLDTTLHAETSSSLAERQVLAVFLAYAHELTHCLARQHWHRVAHASSSLQHHEQAQEAVSLSDYLMYEGGFSFDLAVFGAVVSTHFADPQQPGTVTSLSLISWRDLTQSLVADPAELFGAAPAARVLDSVDILPEACARERALSDASFHTLYSGTWIF